MKPFKLDNYKKIETGFTVPEGYFESFETEIMQRIKPEPKVIPLYRRRKTLWYAAAAVIAIALSIPAINTITSQHNQTDAAALENYFAYANIPDEQIVELLDKEDIEKIQIDYKLEDAAIEDVIESENFDNYILD